MGLVAEKGRVTTNTSSPRSPPRSARLKKAAAKPPRAKLRMKSGDLPDSYKRNEPTILIMSPVPTPVTSRVSMVERTKGKNLFFLDAI